MSAVVARLLVLSQMYLLERCMSTLLIHRPGQLLKCHASSTHWFRNPTYKSIIKVFSHEEAVTVSTDAVNPEAGRL